MTLLARTLPALLAQVQVKHITDAFRNYTGTRQSGYYPFLIAIAVVVVTLVAARAAVHYRRSRRRPLMLFHELSGLHRLGRRVERRLVHVARSHGLADPALLFVCPDLVKQIQSLEASEAGSDNERRRQEEFFKRFMEDVFGESRGQTTNGMEGDSHEGHG